MIGELPYLGPSYFAPHYFGNRYFVLPEPIDLERVLQVPAVLRTVLALEASRSSDGGDLSRTVYAEAPNRMVAVESVNRLVAAQAPAREVE